MRIFALIFTLIPFLANAKNIEELKAQYKTPESLGLAISMEGDERDLGFGDSTVEIEMVLTNRHGQISTRKNRNKTFEIEDTSVGDKSMIIFDEPADVKGTAFLTYSQILEPDDQWLYLPALKRVKRISSKNKSGPFVGSEFAYEDLSSREVGKYSHKYIGDDTCTVNGAQLTCVKLEQVPQYEHSGYTKMITWIDTQEFRPIKVVFYDRKGDLLKTLQFIDYKQYLGKYWRADKFEMVNNQNGKKTELFWRNYKFKTGLNEGDFVKAKLKNIR